MRQLFIQISMLLNGQLSPFGIQSWYKYWVDGWTYMWVGGCMDGWVVGGWRDREEGRETERKVVSIPFKKLKAM